MAEYWGGSENAYSLSDIAEQVKGNRAFVIKSEFNPQTKVKTYVRGWRIDKHLVERVRDYLYTYGDGDQNTPTTEIINPAAADGIIQPGTYKISKIFEEPSLPGNIYETLTCTIDDEAGEEFSILDGCAAKITRWYFWDVGEVEDVPASSSGVEWSISQISRNEEKGTYSYVKEKREAITQNIEYSSLVDSSGTTTDTIYKNVREGDVDEEGQPIPIDDMSVEVGKIKRESRTKNDDCTSDVRQEITEVEDQQGSAYTERADQSEEVETHTQSEELSAPTFVVGQIEEVTSRPTDAGLFATTDRVTTAKDQESSVTWKKDGNTYVQAWWSNQDVGYGQEKANEYKITGKQDIQGKLSISTRENAFGLEDGSLSWTDADEKTKSIGWVSSENSEEETNSVSFKNVHEGNKDEAGQPIDVDDMEEETGKVKRESRQLNGDGTYDLRQDITEAKAQSSTITWQKDGNTYTQKWWSNQTAGYGQSRADEYKKTGSQDIQGKLSISSRENAFGLEDGSLSWSDVDEKTKNIEWVSSENSGEETISAVFKNVHEGNKDETGQDIDADDMEEEAGKIKRESRQLNGDGTYDLRQDIIEVKDQEGSAYTQRADQSEVVETHSEATDAIAQPTFVTGTIREVSSRPTEAGLYATTDRTQTATAQASTVTWQKDGNTYIHKWWSNQAVGYGQTQADSYKKEPEEGEEPTDNIRGQLNISTRQNAFGLEDGTLTWTDADGSPGGESDAWYTGTKTINCSRYKYTTTTEKNATTGATQPVLWKTTATWTESQKICYTHADAVNAIPSSGVEDWHITKWSAKTGSVRWMATWRTGEVCSGQWVRV